MLAKIFVATIGLSLAACASIYSRDSVELSAVIDHPAAYEGERITVVSCVNVTIHGVSLLPCGERRPNVELLESGLGSDGYAGLVDYAQERIGAEPEELPVLVQGTFRSAGIGEEMRFSISPAIFTPYRTR